MERHIIALEIGVRVRHVRTETDARGEPEGELAAEQPVRVEAYIRILATQLVIAQQRAIPRVAAIDTEIDSVVLRGRGRRKERHHQRRCRCYPHQHFHTILLTWVRLADTL